MNQIKLHTGICHFRVARDMELLEFLGAQDFSPLAVSAADLEHALAFGAVYIDGRRQLSSTGVRAGQVLRVHTRPKRYAMIDVAEARARIVFEDDDLIVFNKPSGLPTHATLDNAHENAKALLERVLSRPMFTTHRLDIPTRGLLLLAKSAPACSRLNARFARGEITKIYRVQTDASVALGEYTHYIDGAAHVPRPISREPREGWWTCRLVVEARELVQGAYVHRVRLLTGKTHQIRAQFQALGAPVVGDELYAGHPDTRPFGLECVSLSWQESGQTRAFALE